MSSKTFPNATAKAGVILTAITAGLFHMNCGAGPLEPVVVNWVEVASTTAEISDLAAGGAGDVWLAGEYPPYSGNSRGRVYKWDGTALSEVYALPEIGSTLRGIDFVGDSGWAAGYYPEAGGFKPVLLLYANGAWSRETNLPAGAEKLRELDADGANSFWVASSDGVYRFEDGVWSPLYRLDGVEGVAAGPGGLAVAWPVSDFLWLFDGDAWVKEDITLPAGYSVAGVVDVAPTAGGIYLAAVVQSWHSQFYAVIRRDLAPAGEGAYDLLFFAPHGPYVYYQTCLAFRDARNGLTLGPQTNIICREGVFREGLLPFEVGTPERVAWAAAGERYWAVSRFEGRYHLLFKDD